MCRDRAERVALGAKSCGNTRCTTDLSKRGWAHACEGVWSETSKSTVPWSRIEEVALPRKFRSPWFAVSCRRDGPLVVIQPIWVEKTFDVPPMSKGVTTTHTCARPTSNASTNLGRHCVITHPSGTSPYGSVHSLLASDVHSLVRASGIEIEGSCPTAAAPETGMSTMTGVRDGSVLMDQRWLQ